MNLNRALTMATLFAAGLISLAGCGDGSTIKPGPNLSKSCGTGEVLGLDGSCLIGCPEGQVDVEGKCKIDESKCKADEVLVGGACVPKDGCGAGQEIVDGVCTCPEGKVMSGGFCVRKKGLTIQTTLTPPQRLNVGDAYKAEFKAINGSGDYVWTTADLPDGLSLEASQDSKAATISGAPLEAIAYHIYSLTVAEKADSSKSYTKKVNISIVSFVGVFQEPAQAGGAWISLDVSDPGALLSIPDGRAVKLKVPAAGKSYRWSCDGSQTEDASGIPCIGGGHAGVYLAKEPRPNRVWELGSAEAVFCADKNAYPWCTKPVRDYEVGDNVRYLVPDQSALSVELKTIAIAVEVDTVRMDTTVQSLTFTGDPCAHFGSLGTEIEARWLVSSHQFSDVPVTRGEPPYILDAIKFIGDSAKDPFNGIQDGIAVQSGSIPEVGPVCRIKGKLPSEPDPNAYPMPWRYNVVVSDSCTPANTVGFVLTVTK